ncbi:glycogen synthase kinase-3 alpha-like [Arapaima gigas]
MNATPHPPAPRPSHTDMSGSGRPRTSSFAEPPGAPGAAAAAAGSAVAGGSATGKSGASQASGSSSSGFGNLKMSSNVCLSRAVVPNNDSD